jgi:hypothetical protein
LDPRNHYPHYRPLADFVADIPWTTAKLRAITAKGSDPQVRVVGLQGDDRAYCWLFDPAASWENVVIRKHQPVSRNDDRIDVAGLQPGVYRVQWWNTRSGEVLQQERLVLNQPVLELAVPQWQRDIACKIVPVPADPSAVSSSVSDP